MQTPDSTNEWNDDRVDDVVANLLRYGVSIAAAVVFLGGLIYVFRHGGDIAQYGVFHGGTSEYCNVHHIIQDTFEARGRGLIMLGLLILLATPVARVAFSVFAFAKQGDRVYVVVTSIVLCVLLYSIFLSH